MSEPVSAIQNASDDRGFVRIRDIGPMGMITLRGDLAQRALRKVVTGLTGTDLPQQRMCDFQGNKGIAWMSPDELLILLPYEDVPAALDKLQAGLTKSHALAVNVSDARAIFELRGSSVREVLAKLAPVDMSPEGFTPGMFRRTRMAQVPAAFWMPDEESLRIICFRSVAQYMFNLLKTAARAGSQVGHF